MQKCFILFINLSLKSCTMFLQSDWPSLGHNRHDGTGDRRRAAATSHGVPFFRYCESRGFEPGKRRLVSSEPYSGQRPLYHSRSERVLHCVNARTLSADLRFSNVLFLYSFLGLLIISTLKASIIIALRYLLSCFSFIIRIVTNLFCYLFRIGDIFCPIIIAFLCFLMYSPFILQCTARWQVCLGQLLVQWPTSSWSRDRCSWANSMSTQMWTCGVAALPHFRRSTGKGTACVLIRSVSNDPLP